MVESSSEKVDVSRGDRLVEEIQRLSRIGERLIWLLGIFLCAFIAMSCIGGYYVLTLRPPPRDWVLAREPQVRPAPTNSLATISATVNSPYAVTNATSQQISGSGDTGFHSTVNSAIRTNTLGSKGDLNATDEVNIR